MYVCAFFQGPGSLPVRSQAGFLGGTVRPQGSQSGIGQQVILSLEIAREHRDRWLRRTNLTFVMEPKKFSRYRLVFGM